MSFWVFCGHSISRTSGSGQEGSHSDSSSFIHQLLMGSQCSDSPQSNSTGTPSKQTKYLNKKIFSALRLHLNLLTIGSHLDRAETQCCWDRSPLGRIHCRASSRSQRVARTAARSAKSKDLDCSFFQLQCHQSKERISCTNTDLCAWKLLCRRSGCQGAGW